MILICANLGRIRAFRISKQEDTPDPANQIHELSNDAFDDGPTRIGDAVSDKSGRFRSDGSPGMSHGEPHAKEQEDERRLIAQLAERIAAVVNKEKPGPWALAAPKTIHRRLLDALPADVRGRLGKTEEHDFSKLPTLEVGRRFGLIG